MLLARLCKAIMSSTYIRCVTCGNQPEKNESSCTNPSCAEAADEWSVHLAYGQLHKAITEVMKEHHVEVKREADGPDLYDPTFGDELECQCGHVYYRHFDSYEDMYPVGCKYCHSTEECPGFELAEETK